MLLTARIESLSLPDALGISLLGFSIVFAVLVLLMATIAVLRSVMSKLEPAPAAAPAPAAPPAAEMIPAKGSLGEIELHNVDDKTAAMIMAIAADEIGAPLNELRFKSIKEKL